MESYEIDTLVIGAGVVGIAVARALALQGREVWLIEKEDEIGSQTSSRNSEVIHAGIYYPEGSLKAELCVRGKGLLYDYCQQRGVPFQKTGKLIVAVNEAEVDKLSAIKQHALQNGVADIVSLDAQAVAGLEPELIARAGLYSPSTGIVDSHALMMQLLADFQNAGGQLVLNTELKPISLKSGNLSFELFGQDSRITARNCVNATGLQAIGLLYGHGDFPADYLPKAYFARGDYFSYSGKVPFQHLVYPVPEPGGLGVHLTLDMNGVAKFGPDVTWIKPEEPICYSVNADHRDKFASAIRSYWPELDETRLNPDYSGIRPKVSGPNEPAADFIIQDHSAHGIKGLVNLFGIESPGLTSCLAIAENVVERF